MAALVGHLNQAGHHRAHLKQRLQYHQHRQPGHEVLAEGQGEGQQHLGTQGAQQAVHPGQGFAQQQTGEYQRQQDQGQLIPDRDHLLGDQRDQATAGGDEQPQAAGKQGLWNAPAVHPQPPTQQRAQHQESGHQDEGEQGPKQTR